MKKISLYVFLVLMWCNVGFAKPVLLECLDDDSIPDRKYFEYLSLDLDKREFYIVATKAVLKGDCALGNCEEITKHNLKYDFVSENAEYLKIANGDVQQLSINKKNLELTWYSYYFDEQSDGNFKKVETYSYYSCKTINKFPFK